MSLSIVSTHQPRINPNIVIAKGDSAASDHYFRLCDTKCLANITPMKSAPILLPDKSSITSSHMGFLPNTGLTTKGSAVKILPELRSASLISVGKLCDDGCTVHFDEQSMHVHKNNKLIMQGTRNNQDGLYDIPIAKVNLAADNYRAPQPHPALYYKPTPNSPIDYIKKRLGGGPPRENLLNKAFPSLHILASHNECDQLIDQQVQIDQKCFAIAEIFRSHPALSVIIRKKQSKMDLARYLHATCFSPVKSTWTKGIDNNHFSTWPGLTSRLILKNLPLSQATVQGHIKRERQGLQSTTKPSKAYQQRMEELKLKLQLLKAKRKPTETLQDVLTADIMTDAFPSSPDLNLRTQ